MMPNDLIPAVVTALRPSAELKGVRLETDYANDDRTPVWCDKLKVQKIALNLISNAIKYTPDGGAVRVLVRPARQDADSRWLLTVEDTGIGMSEEFMGRMYEPFAQEKRSEATGVAGTGLGLSIVKRYVDLMGGAIEVESRLHEGTRWTVSLPIRQADEAAGRQKDAVSARQSLVGERVLLCEDNIMNTEIATVLLKDQGIAVDSAENGQLGVQKFAASDSGWYDAILMDIRMPVMDGLTAAQQIRGLDRPDAKTVPIIAMTADAFEENVRQALSAGMNGYVTKPIEPEKLFRALADAVSGNRNC